MPYQTFSWISSSLRSNGWIIIGRSIVFFLQPSKKTHDASFGRLSKHDVGAVKLYDSKVGAMCVCDYFKARVGYQIVTIWIK